MGRRVSKRGGKKVPAASATASAQPVSAAMPSFVSHQVTLARRYFLDLNPPPNAGLTVVCGGVETVAPDYEVVRETFPFWCVEYVAEGKGWLFLNGQTHELLAGSIFVYGPGLGHAIRAQTQEPMRKYYVDFAGRRAADLLRERGLAPGTFRQLGASLDVRELFDLLQKYGMEQGELSPQLCGDLLPVLLTRIAHVARIQGTAASPARETYEQIKMAMREKFLQLRTLEEVARHCRVSEEYICRLFQRFDQVRPYQFLMRQRMYHAARLLSEPRLLVKQVARELGFADQYQFSRAFKRVFGIAPTGYQELQSQPRERLPK